MRITILAAGMIVGGMSLFGADSVKPASLYQRLGGMPAIRAVIDDFVTRILQDEKVAPFFAHAASSPENTAAYKARLADFVCQATGGPCQYTGADMVTAHKGRGVTEEAFNAVVADLVATLDKLQVPDQEKSQLLGLLAPMKPAIVQSKPADR